MTDEQIIKSVGVCKTGKCSGCLYHVGSAVCISILMKDVFDLINRQKAEIEELNRIIKGREQLVNTLNKCYRQAKSEAIKEFAEKAKSSFNDLLFRTKTQRKNISVKAYDDNANWILHELVPTEIDNLVKEMTEVQE